MKKRARHPTSSTTIREAAAEGIPFVMAVNGPRTEENDWGVTAAYSEELAAFTFIAATLIKLPDDKRGRVLAAVQAFFGKVTP